MTVDAETDWWIAVQRFALDWVAAGVAVEIKPERHAVAAVVEIVENAVLCTDW